MYRLDRTLPTLAENLALDEALLIDAEAGGPEVLRFWDWPDYAVVLGAGGPLHGDVDVAACGRDGVTIARRSSGGGTVLLGPGCLLFSLVLRFERAAELRDINASYRWILGRVGSALGPFTDGPIELAGICDLAIAGRKFSGNAQHRKQRCVLHHGTVLHDFDLTRVGRYLRLPERRPDYRGERAHGDFVRNLGATPERLREALASAWEATEPLAAWPAAKVAELVETKLGRSDWVTRR